MTAGFSQIGNYTPDFLIAGDADDLIGKVASFPAGLQLARGTVLGRIGAAAATPTCTQCKAGASDGSQTPYAVLAEAIDTTAAAGQGLIYLAGTFAKQALVLDSSLALEVVADQFRQLGINLVSAQGGLNL